MTRAVCPGSFDPVTHGHLDVIERTARIVDDVVVAVGTNISKNALFTPAERVEMLAEECAQWSNVAVTLFEGLLVDFCTANDIDIVSKGLRAADLAYELQMAQMNRRRCDLLFAREDCGTHHGSGRVSKCGSNKRYVRAVSSARH
jgi:pantetheine-phosphate adenylyltransferase